ncbi:hypothetical protein CYMTET_47861 [Cymbomonas tetramitiformis]|uniref:NADAR domain-containing protein n=1 Tax=Cymbomonas tetramitiformis TaxID=36881 RepID=A0AAE0BTD3_9CHLO|nr:hypothetical protein CYMTET_47861 [Cymbomonas tetramitiformis]
MKYTSKDDARKKMLEATPYAGESDSSYGNRVWRLGQQHDISTRKWESQKVQIMYSINCAKYAQNPDLQQELLTTGKLEITGAPSTWQWSYWNGWIQTQIREELRTDLGGSKSALGSYFLEHASLP